MAPPISFLIAISALISLVSAQSSVILPAKSSKGSGDASNVTFKPVFHPVDEDYEPLVHEPFLASVLGFASLFGLIGLIALIALLKYVISMASVAELNPNTPLITRGNQAEATRIRTRCDRQELVAHMEA